MSELINQRDLEFLLYDWLDVEALCEASRFAAHSRAETFEPILEMAHKLAETHFATHAAALDANPPEFDGERVQIIPEVKVALDAFSEAGFISAAFDEAHGGLQLPYTISQAAMAMFYAANTATAAYPLLTMAAANLLAHHGNLDLRARFLKQMLEGRFFGTMCLSEPGAGSSLGDLTTRAAPADDGSYRIIGSKMWISGAEHDLAENIIHLVLAKLPDAPPGVKGISLFAVPRHLVRDDGSLGARNDVAISGLNHKMGYRGTVNAVLNFGEQGGAVGYLVGEPHKGLAIMFHMMNEARVGVGLGATMLGYAGYLFSLAYARQRPQGRLPWQKNLDSPQVPIIQHPDVKRMLLAQKAWVEGALGLCLYCARLVDELAISTPSHRDERLLLLELLTPIAKAWPAEYCLEANKLAMQVLGGYGYAKDYPVERFYRDNRLNAIHEGTNGIQALDLLGRKVTRHQGAGFHLLMQKLQETITRAMSVTTLSAFARRLALARERAMTTTATLAQAALGGDLPRFLANASPYLDMLGHTVIAWIWLEQALVATANLDDTGRSSSEQEQAFLKGKIQACRFFFQWELPKTRAQAELLQSLDETTLTMSEDWF